MSLLSGESRSAGTARVVSGLYGSLRPVQTVDREDGSQHFYSPVLLKNIITLFLRCLKILFLLQNVFKWFAIFTLLIPECNSFLQPVPFM